MNTVKNRGWRTMANNIFTKTALSCSVIRLGAVFFVLPNIAPISITYSRISIFFKRIRFDVDVFDETNFSQQIDCMIPITIRIYLRLIKLLSDDVNCQWRLVLY